MKQARLITQFIIIVPFISLLIIGCKKETSDSGLSPSQEEDVVTVSSQSEIETEFVFNDVFNNVIGVNTEVGVGGTGVFERSASGLIQGGRETNTDSIPTCVTLTVTRLNAPALFPVRIIIDFGGGCAGKDGHTRSGKIVTTYTGRITVPGKSASTTFEGFKLDSISIQGTHTITNTTATGSIQRQLTVDIDARLTRPAGDYSQWVSRRIITQTEGNGTPDISFDDVFSIAGSAHGKVKRGNDFYSWHSQIMEPLLKRLSCRWVSQGILKVWRESLSNSSQWTATLNYGDGTCDYSANLTINGATRTIILPR